MTLLSEQVPLRACNRGQRPRQVSAEEYRRHQDSSCAAQLRCVNGRELLESSISNVRNGGDGIADA